MLDAAAVTGGQAADCTDYWNQSISQLVAIISTSNEVTISITDLGNSTIIVFLMNVMML